MKNKKKTIVKIIAGVGGVLVVALAIMVIIGVQQSKQTEEIWAFRETLDEVYFPVYDEIAACVYEDGDATEYSCLVGELSDKTQKAKERVTAYEVTSDDAKMLKNEVLNGIDIIENITEHNDNNDPEGKDASELAKQISNLTKDKEDFYNHNQKLIKILDKYYD